MPESESAAAHSPQVQALYERQPYPTPPTELEDFRLRRMLVRGAPSLYGKLYWPAEPMRGGRSILVAGCGTAQAAQLALYEPTARILAIDFSARSLAHTRMLLDKYQLKQVETRQLPIERLHEIDEHFDLVISTGVLHHLPDPQAGLRQVRARLKPAGSAYLMVYGQYARTGVYMLQRYCQMLGVDFADADLQALQQMLKQLPEDHPLAPLARRSQDLHCLPGLADMFVHPCDRAYTVPQVYDWLAGAGMKMQRWLMQAQYLPQGCALAGTPHAAKLRALPLPQQHEAVELFRGHLHTHDLIACRDDRDDESFTLHWEDASRWRSYVPAPLPGIAARTENLPSGALVELYQQAHEHPVLCPRLGESGVKLYQQMDGQRPLSAIAQRAGAAPEQARDFFRMLWEFDQVSIALPG